MPSALDQTLRLPSGRVVGFADHGGGAGDTAVLWCHGGPGSRNEPAYVAPAAVEAGLRIIGIDRPGYGLSDVDVGRTIGGWVPEALAVADHLGIDRFLTVGISTGGAYALAVAALAPGRVIAAVLCCSMTDMRHEPARATMSRSHALDVWDAPDRDSAMAAAIASHGIDGSKIMESGADGPPLAPSDLAMLVGHRFGRLWIDDVPNMFAHGLAGYTDDRRADGGGWTTFDVTAVTCPVTVLHGAADIIATPVHAHHTATLLPQARLHLVPHMGHFSIQDHLVPTLTPLSRRPGREGRGGRGVGRRP